MEVCQTDVDAKYQSAVCVQFAEKYGKVFSLRIFGGRTVVINGYKLLKEALVQNGGDYEDRPVIPSIVDFAGNRGRVPSLL